MKPISTLVSHVLLLSLGTGCHTEPRATSTPATPLSSIASNAPTSPPRTEPPPNPSNAPTSQPRTEPPPNPSNAPTSPPRTEPVSNDNDWKQVTLARLIANDEAATDAMKRFNEYERELEPYLERLYAIARQHKHDSARIDALSMTEPRLLSMAIHSHFSLVRHQLTTQSLRLLDDVALDVGALVGSEHATTSTNLPEIVARRQAEIRAFELRLENVPHNQTLDCYRQPRAEGCKKEKLDCPVSKEWRTCASKCIAHLIHSIDNPKAAGPFVTFVSYGECSNDCGVLCS